MKIKFLMLSVLLVVASTVFGQLKVHSTGAVTINANIQNWWSGLKVTVPTQNSCAYHLNYNNEDVFYVNANGSAWAKTGAFWGSDINLKENINPIENPLDKVLSLRGVQYDYKGQEGESQGQRVGFIAQEIEEILPGIVTTDNRGIKGVAYSDVIPLTVEAIKEQQALIKDLQTLVLAQQKELEALKRELSGE